MDDINYSVVALVVIYEFLVNLHSLMYSTVNKEPNNRLSILQIKVWKQANFLSNSLVFFMALTRFNGAAFLLFYGYSVSWLVAICVWLFSAYISLKIGNFLIARLTKVAITTTILGLPITAIIGVILWIIVA